MFNVVLPAKNDNNSLRIVWIHGWGGSHEGLLPLAGYFTDNCENVLFDLDGFGRSPEPISPKSSKDYAADILSFLNTLPPKDTIVCGFSYGGRVAVHMAAMSDNIKGLILLSAAGIPVRHSLYWKIKAFLVKKVRHLAEKVKCLSFLKGIAKGSRDYELASPVMKKTLVMSLQEDMSQLAKNINIPVVLIYGEKDTATPPYMAHEYNSLFGNSYLHMLPKDSHLSVLTSPQTTNIIEEFLADNF